MKRERPGGKGEFLLKYHCDLPAMGSASPPAPARDGQVRMAR